MFDRIEVKRFRGITSLDAGPLARVNIFTGRNGSGKTSVLEAVLVLGNYTSPHSLLNLSQHRDMPLPSLQFDIPLRSYFYNMDPDPANAPILTAEVRGERRVLEIGAIFGAPREVSAQPTGEGGQMPLLGSVAPDQMAGVQFKLSSRPETRGGRIVLQPHGSQIIAGSGAPANQKGAFFVDSRRMTSIAETAEILTRLIQNRHIEELYNLLQSVSPKVKSLSPGLRGGQPIILADVGGPTLLPIQLLGDGFCRACLIGAGLVGSGSELLVVDEIDSGLHHSVIKPFWEVVASLGRSLGVQVFCTTHNDEMIGAAVAAFENCPNDLAVFRLDRNAAGNHRAVRYDYERLLAADKLQVEVR
jgi:energy-coupling factor transporter ATP-binding protein EcfA2